MALQRAGAIGSVLPAIVFVLAIIGCALLVPRVALADCAPAPAASGDIVRCVGTVTNGFGTTLDAITVNVLDGASVSRPGQSDGVIQLGTLGVLPSPDSTIDLFGNSQVTWIGSGANGIGLAIFGSNGAITLHDSSSILGDSGLQNGIVLRGGGTVTLNDSANISADGSSTTGISHSTSAADFHAATLNGNASIILSGVNSIGVQSSGDNGHTTLNDNAEIISDVGVLLDNNNGTVTLNDRATISAIDIGILIRGAGNIATINDAATVTTSEVGSNAVRFTSGASTLVNYGTLRSAGTTVTDIGVSTTVFNYGTFFSGNGSAVNLAGGNDQLTLGTGSNITGSIDGGAGGTDTVTLTGRGSEDDVFFNFENLVMDGDDWSLSGASSFGDIDVDAGRLAINGAIAATGATTVAFGGTLGGNGTLTTPSVTSSGVIAPGNSVGMLNIVGTLAQTGGAFDVEFDKSGIDRTNVTGAVTLVGSPTVNIIPLNGAGGASGIFLHSDTSITGAIGKVDYRGNGAATVFQSGNDLNLIAMDGSTVVASNFAALQTGLDYLDTVRGMQLDQKSDCIDGTCAVTTGRRFWAQGFGRFGAEDAQDGNKPYDYRNAGTALGGDIDIGNGITLGGSLGYANTETEVEHHAAEADIDGEFAALYLTYETGGFFVTGIVSGGLQQLDLERKVANAGGTDAARADTSGFLIGGALQVGYHFDFPGAWRLTPSAGLAYQYQSVDGYSEHGAGTGDVDIGDQNSDAFRANAELNVSRTVAYDDFSLIPHISFGLAGQTNNGDNVAGGFSNGANFTLAQQDDDRVMGLAGAGMDIAFANGVTANIDYDAQLSSDGDQHAVMGGVKFEW